MTLIGDGTVHINIFYFKMFSHRFEIVSQEFRIFRSEQLDAVGKGSLLGQPRVGRTQALLEQIVRGFGQPLRVGWRRLQNGGVDLLWCWRRGGRPFRTTYDRIGGAKLEKIALVWN